MADFFHRLSYSFGNEDPRSEQRALQLGPSDRVIAVTGSGDRPLHHLQHGPAEVIAVDANAIQNHLLELKSAAMAQLAHPEYLAFLGGTHCRRRHETLRGLDLPRETTDFWLHHKHMIEEGVLYQGATEKLLKFASKVVGRLRKKKVRTLFSFDNLEEQMRFVEKKWNTPIWRKGFALAYQMSSLILRDPGMKHIDQSIHPGNHHIAQMTRILNLDLAKENFLLSLILQGKVAPEAYPPYLTAEGVEQIKPHLHKLTIETNDLVSYLESVPEASFDAFSLSDVASYVDHPTYTRLMKAVSRAARPGARFCIRQYLSRYTIPEELSTLFQRNTALESELNQTDNSLFYTFMVGTISGQTQ